MTKGEGGWKHRTCSSLPAVYSDKVLCVVCGSTKDEKEMVLRKSGFKCRKCVGKAHRSDVIPSPSTPMSLSGSGRDVKALSDGKDMKRSVPPVGTVVAPISASACVTCSLQLRIPPGQNLITCPSCRTVMNPYDRDLRFMKCGSCRSLLQFSLSRARSSGQGPVVRCGRCDTPNSVPQSILHPIPSRSSAPVPVVVGFVGGQMVVARSNAPESSRARGGSAEGGTAKVYLQSLPVHKYKTPEKARESDNTECSFCLCEFEDGENVKTLPCFHMFHQHEIDKWLSSHTECPLCKTSVL